MKPGNTSLPAASTTVAPGGGARSGATWVMSNPSGGTIQILDDGIGTVSVGGLTKTVTQTDEQSGNAAVALFTDGTTAYTGSLDGGGHTVTLPAGTSAKGIKGLTNVAIGGGTFSIDAAAGSSLTVVQVVLGDAEGGVSANLTRIRAAEGAHVVLVQVQLLGNCARRWNAVAIEQGTSARVEQVRIELGGSVVACGARTLLNHNKCEYDLDAVYFGHSNDVLDFNDVSVHTGRDTLCEMHTAGVLTGSADKILRGTVDFQRGAKRGVGHESEDVLLFSPSARNRTAPLILCGEEEVEGQHAASVGRLDENKLYYLRSRGLSEAQARRLMVDARFAPAIDKIPLDSLQDEVRENVARRLNDELDG